MSFGGPVLGMFATTGQLLRRDPGPPRRAVPPTPTGRSPTRSPCAPGSRTSGARRLRRTSAPTRGSTPSAAAIHLAWLGPPGPRRDRAPDPSRRPTTSPAPRRDPRRADRRRGPLRQRVPDPAVRPTQRPSSRRWPNAGYLAGIPLPGDYPEFPGGLLVAVTEQRTQRTTGRVSPPPSRRCWPMPEPGGRALSPRSPGRAPSRPSPRCPPPGAGRGRCRRSTCRMR